MLVSVSFLKNKLGIEETIKKIDSSNADMIHVDVMDGEFVSEKNFTYDTIKDSFIGINKELDVHLMVNNVFEYVKDFVKLKPKYISFHIEAVDNPKEIISFLKENNIKVGLAIKPETRVFELLPYLKDIDLIIVLSVNPGLGGQQFIQDVIPKIRELNALKSKYNYLISVDGGVNDETIKQFESDIVVSGSYITMEDDYDLYINRLKKDSY